MHLTEFIQSRPIILKNLTPVRMLTVTHRANSSFLKRVWFGAMVFMVLSTATAHAWWDDGWSSRKKVTIDTSATGVAISEQVGSVPVLLRLVGGNFNFAGAKEDGTDLRFVAEDDKTLLPFHIEKFDALMNEAFVWVKVPELKPGAKTVIWLYYGNAGDKVLKVEDAKSTYDADTVLVYHFNAQGQPAYDFSNGGNTAQNPGAAAEGSMIGSGLKVDGKSTVTIPASPTLFWTEGSAMTWSAWVRFGTPQPNAAFFSRRETSKYFLLGADAGSPFVEVTYQGGSVRSSAGVPVAPNSWHHVAVIAAGETIKLFLDGELYGTAKAPLPAMNGPVVLGGNGVNNLMNLAGAGFNGEIDELEISKVARSTDYIKLAIAAQGGGEPAAKLVTMVDEVKKAGLLDELKNGYVGVIVGSLTFDGWVVIGILAIMSVISWLVMVGKASYLNRVGKGNEMFLKEWRQVATDLSVLENNDGSKVKSMGLAKGSANHRVMLQAPLYRIYHIGVEEIRHRMAKDQEAGSRKALSSRSIQAIRASLDGGLVRETQRLNDKMVLLTIAISGGPFLGLLGTVVGVMITFAAVAQAGDVNVNAIAPGIAAALLATVAGLAVAIPALFGYNYLLTRIKNATTDTHVFIDEFVTKLAEFYRE
jgi:biopolymer transport protein ExbB